MSITLPETASRWLGEVPSDWQVVPLKHVAHVFPSNVDKHSHESETPVRLCNYTDVYYNDLIDDGSELTSATASDSEIAKFSLRAGDTIITKDSESAGDIGLSAYVPRDLPGVVCGYHLSMVRPRGPILGSFVKRLFDTAYVRAVLEVSANGLTRVGLGQYVLDNLDIPLPPIRTQQLIMDFLDRETAKIDALIAKQEQLIATLQEDRSATIARALTAGLDPHVRMKSSGQPWCGDVPHHWGMVPIKHVVSGVGVGLVINPSTYVSDSGVPFLLGRNVRDGWIDLTNVNLMSEQDSRRLKSSRLEAGDVVVVRAGYPGRAAVVPPDLEGANCASVLILRRPKLVRSEYLAAFFNSSLGRAQVSLAQYGAAQEQINVGDVVDFLIPVPPAAEQVEIAHRVAGVTSSVDTLVTKSTDMIKALREYRAALITDAVTGKIDVREMV